MSPSPFCCTRHREKEDNASVLTDEGLHLVDRLALLAGLHQLLPLGQLGQTLDQRVHQVHLTLSDTVAVRHVPGAASAGGVDTRRSAGLELHGLEHGLPKVVGRHLLKHNHAARAQTSAQVARARQDPAQVVVVHEVLALSLQHLLHLVARADETRGHLLDVLTVRGGLGTVTLHADDAKVVLLVQPHEKVLRVVVEDTTTVRPVPAHTARQQQGRVRLLEKVAHLTELLLLLLGHSGRLRGVAPAAVQGVVVTLEVPVHLQQRLNGKRLQLTPLLEADHRRQLEPAHATARAHTRGEHVLVVRVGVSRAELVELQVGGLLRVRAVPAVAHVDERVEQVLEHRVRLLVTGGGTNGLDVRVPRVVDTGLDALREGHTRRRLLVAEVLVDLGLTDQQLGHEVRVLRQVRHLLRRRAVQPERRTLVGAVVRLVPASDLDPALELPHVGAQAARGVVITATGEEGGQPLPGVGGLLLDECLDGIVDNVRYTLRAEVLENSGILVHHSCCFLMRVAIKYRN
eukprot:Hpha_TRINITY_DN16106_c1_g1::TRINITY_DN16106_c1_g1_i4::g.4075::m.4075